MTRSEGGGFDDVSDPWLSVCRDERWGGVVYVWSERLGLIRPDWQCTFLSFRGTSDG